MRGERRELLAFVRRTQNPAEAIVGEPAEHELSPTIDAKDESQTAGNERPCQIAAAECLGEKDRSDGTGIVREKEHDRCDHASRGNDQKTPRHVIGLTRHHSTRSLSAENRSAINASRSSKQF